MLGKQIIALVARGHGHYGTGAVARQHIIGNPYRYLFAAERVQRIAARKGARYRFGVRHAVQFRFLLGLVNISVHLGLLCRGSQRSHQFMFRGDDQKGYPEKRINTGSENFNNHPRRISSGRGDLLTTDI